MTGVRALLLFFNSFSSRIPCRIQIPPTPRLRTEAPHRPSRPAPVLHVLASQPTINLPCPLIPFSSPLIISWSAAIHPSVLFAINVSFYCRRSFTACIHIFTLSSISCIIAFVVHPSIYFVLFRTLHCLIFVSIGVVDH